MKQPPREQITVNFTGDDVQLFKLLRHSAKCNRRTLTAELLYRLEASITGDYDYEMEVPHDRQ